jgi:hypothetical protein
MCEAAERRLEHERSLHRQSSRTVHALYAFAYGLVNGYPFCCVLRYALTDLRYDRHQPQAVVRGGLRRRSCGDFVACGVFHQGKWGSKLCPALLGGTLARWNAARYAERHVDRTS